VSASLAARPRPVHCALKNQVIHWDIVSERLVSLKTITEQY